MEIDKENQTFPALEALINQESDEKLVEMLTEMPTAHVIDFLKTQEEGQILTLLDLIDHESYGRIFSDLDSETQTFIFSELPRPKMAKIFNYVSSDVRADFYKELELEKQNEFLPYLEKKIREDIIALSSYPSESAGGIMTTDFATIISDMTANEALNKLRQDAPSKQMIYYLYVVNDTMKMQGILTLKNLVYAEPDDKIKDLINEFFVFANVNEDQESVAKKIEKYDLVAIPVLNDYQQLVGIVHHDDAIEIIRAEQTEDMEKFMGIVPTENDLGYLETPSIQHFKKRAMWIVLLALIGLISGMIIHKYKDILEQLIILALYMPMMTATGGNSGSQAATVVIRALSLGEIQDKDWLRIVFKEAKISFMLSFCVAGLIFLKIAFFSYKYPLPAGLTITYIGFLISVAIALQVISSAVIGAGLPLIVKRFGGDPAVAASPAITTVVDITGLCIYFGIVSSNM